MTPSPSPEDLERVIDRVRALHVQVRDRLIEAMTVSSVEHLAGIDRCGLDDTIYRIDVEAEEALVPGLTAWGGEEPIHVVAEGMGEETGGVLFPSNADADAVRWHVLIDPIDGTRGLMYAKRSAWIVTGVAPNVGRPPRLADIQVAVQTEIPTPKQTRVDQLWAQRSAGALAVREDLVTGGVAPLSLRPSRAIGLADGFASLSKFFLESKAELAAIEQSVWRRFQAQHSENGMIFDDQYVSSAGQLHELTVGHDRVNGDLRAVLLTSGEAPDRPRTGVHPYDLAAVLIAQEAGVEVTGGHGEPLDAPFDTTSDVAWLGYANRALREKLEPLILDELRRRGYVPN